MCGDCTDPEVVAAAVRGETVGLIASDPPYSRPARDYSGRGRTPPRDFMMGAGEMSREEYRTFLSRSFEAVLRHLANGASIYCYMDGRHIGDLIEAGLRVGFEIRNTLVWDKGSAGLGNPYRSANELIALFRHGTAAAINNVAKTRKSGRDRQTIWRYPGFNRFSKGRDRALSWHATIKRSAMLCDLILDASHPGDIVYDGFGGSGSVLVSAHKTGRRGRLVEIDPQYVDVAIERLRLAFGIEPVERGSGLSFTALATLRADTAAKEVCDAQ